MSDPAPTQRFTSEPILYEAYGRHAYLERRGRLYPTLPQNESAYRVSLITFALAKGPCKEGQRCQNAYTPREIECSSAGRRRRRLTGCSPAGRRAGKGPAGFNP